MTLSEFKKAIKEWGNNWGIEADTNIFMHWVNVRIKIGRRYHLIASISGKYFNVFDFPLRGAPNLKNEVRKPLLEIIQKFASTPLADRKDKEKKFYLRHKSEFTMAEIENIKMLFNTDLSDFELIEVEEDVEKIKVTRPYHLEINGRIYDFSWLQDFLQIVGGLFCLVGLYEIWTMLVLAS